MYEKIHLDCPIPLRTVARFASADEDDLLLLNPALGTAVRNGRASVPHGYQLRLPSGASIVFLEHYNPWQEKEKTRLAALEEARKARLAARKRAGGKTMVAKRGKRAQIRQIARDSDSKTRKRRG